MVESSPAFTGFLIHVIFKAPRTTPFVFFVPSWLVFPVSAQAAMVECPQKTLDPHQQPGKHPYLHVSPERRRQISPKQRLGLCP